MNHLTPEQLDEIVEQTAASQVETHLRSCPACQLNLASIRALDRKLREMPPEAAPAHLTQQVMERIGSEANAAASESARSSFSWLLFRNLAPVFALGILGIMLFAAMKVFGLWDVSGLQQTSKLTQSVYNEVGSGFTAGVQVFNGWMSRYFSFAFARDASGLTVFVLVFFAVVAWMDKFFLMPMMKRKAMK